RAASARPEVGRQWLARLVPADNARLWQRGDIMKSRLSVALAAASCALALSVGPSMATVVTYDVSATFGLPPVGAGWSACAGCSLSGSLQIDTATGFVPANTIDITMTGQPGVGPFTHFDGGSATGNGLHLAFDDTHNHFLNFYFPV